MLGAEDRNSAMASSVRTRLPRRRALLGAEDRNDWQTMQCIKPGKAAPGFARRRGSELYTCRSRTLTNQAAPGFARRRGSELQCRWSPSSTTTRRRRALLGAEDRNCSVAGRPVLRRRGGAGLCSAPRIGTAVSLVAQFYDDAAAPGFARRRGSEPPLDYWRGAPVDPAAPGFARRRGSEHRYRAPKRIEGWRRRRALLGAEDRNADHVLDHRAQRPAAPGFARRRGSEHPSMAGQPGAVADAAPGFARRRGSEHSVGRTDFCTPERRRALLGAEDRNTAL